MARRLHAKNSAYMAAVNRRRGRSIMRKLVSVLLTMAALGAPVSGCVLPLPLQDEDSDVNSSEAPLIEWGPTRPDWHAPLTVTQTQDLEFDVWIRYTDADIVYLRMFLDHDYSTVIHEADATGTLSGAKNARFTVEELCGAKVNNVPDRYHLELVISDLPWLPDGESWDLKLAEPGAQKAWGWWIVDCVPDAPGDGGL